MGYCVSCGVLMDAHGLLCAQCSADFAVSNKKVGSIVDRKVDVDYLESVARSCRTALASAMVAALCNGRSRGFKYGW